MALGLYLRVSKAQGSGGGGRRRDAEVPAQCHYSVAFGSSLLSAFMVTRLARLLNSHSAVCCLGPNSPGHRDTEILKEQLVTVKQEVR